DCALSDILPVGWAPAGDGRWGQADLAGNIGEWVRDTWHSDFPPPTCSNCARLDDDPTLPLIRVLRGGDWLEIATHLPNDFRLPQAAAAPAMFAGFRCARD